MEDGRLWLTVKVTVLVRPPPPVPGQQSPVESGSVLPGTSPGCGPSLTAQTLRVPSNGRTKRTGRAGVNP